MRASANWHSVFPAPGSRVLATSFSALSFCLAIYYAIPSFAGTAEIAKGRVLLDGWQLRVKTR